ncbi:DUF4169 family protein [Aureimonas fodinaquatilis]|uniref:DUF4169 family protein n=1 Tax=Aureimonas fodinaquatilis TaxID=2565783 RepID=A0A5B0E0K7_9HYPH|nr:DUF4169 family protein [Aureimonas fodinaquatilis]KAA0972604.1 DUF4169 family protein [Aureimonas fodinaquatilis]
MADIVNLRTARKRVARQKAADDAEQNRLIHGLSKRDKAMAAVENKETRQRLDGARLEIDPGGKKK